MARVPDPVSHQAMDIAWLECGNGLPRARCVPALWRLPRGNGWLGVGQKDVRKEIGHSVRLLWSILVDKE